MNRLVSFILRPWYWILFRYRLWRLKRNMVQIQISVMDRLTPALEELIDSISESEGAR